MAVRCFVTGYGSRAIDRKVNPPVLRMLADYFVYEDQAATGEVASAPVELALSATPAQQADAIKAAVVDHIQNVITYTPVPLAANVRLPRIDV